MHGFRIRQVRRVIEYGDPHGSVPCKWCGVPLALREIRTVLRNQIVISIPIIAGCLVLDASPLAYSPQSDGGKSLDIPFLLMINFMLIYSFILLTTRARPFVRVSRLLSRSAAEDGE